MESEPGVVVFLKVLLFALFLNLVAHAAFGAWSSYFAAVVSSVSLAGAVWLGQRLRAARR